MTTTLKIHPFSMPLTELSAVIRFLTGVRDERMGPAGIAPSELLTPEEKAALLTPAADECGEPLEEHTLMNNHMFSIDEARAVTAELGEEGVREMIRASAGGDQQPYAVNAGGSDDFAELREPSAEEAFAPKPTALPVVPAAPGTTAQASSPAGSETVDKDGLPWDERIHSGSKATNADGTWRRKRGVHEGIVREVEEQLRSLKGIAATQPNPEVPAAPKPPVPPVPGLAPTAAPAPAAPPVPPPPAPAVTATAGPSSPVSAEQSATPQSAQPVTFASLFKRVTELKKANDGKTFPGEDDILAALSMPTWVALAATKDQDLFEAAWGLLP